MMFKEKISDLMKKEGISQRDLAKKIQINESAMSRYLSGERTPRIDIATKLARYFGISVEELLDEQTKDENFIELRGLVARNASNLSNKEISELITLLSKNIKNENEWWTIWRN